MGLLPIQNWQKSVPEVPISVPLTIPFSFVRIHRSQLVNAAMVRSAEPTGDGRLTIHLMNNVSLVSSRAGAKRFREFIAA